MDFQLPELGEGVYEAEMVRWLVKPGDTIKRGQSLLEVMTDKATMEVPAPFAGKITQLMANEGAKLKVGEVILAYAVEGAEIPAPIAQRARVAAGVSESVADKIPKRSQANGVTVVAAPSIRHLARKLGIDLTQIEGSGPAGRILLDDITAKIDTSKLDGKATKEKKPPAVDYGKPGSRIKFQGIRRKIAEHLVDSVRRIPHYSYIDECDVTELVRLRQSLREPCAERGIKLTYLPFFVKAVAQALREIPIANSSLDEAKEEIVLHDVYNIGIAVAAPTGLVVPVIRDAHRKDLFAIASEIDRLASDAKANRSKRDDLRGGTFTVTSIGNIGGLISTPIINHPEVGIMGVGQIVRRPVYDAHESIKPADLLYLSFSFDHRVLDGAIGAAFGNAVKKHLENPAAMLVDRPV